jgi:hypothetical protein
MTYTLTVDQLTDLQADLGITTDQLVFTDAALNRLYTRAAGDYDATVVYALRQLRQQAAKGIQYTIGQTSFSRQQWFDHLTVLLKEAEARAGMGGGTLSAGVIDLEIDSEDA